MNTNNTAMAAKFQIVAPILLIGFNRPDIIKKTLQNLREYSLEKLYIAIDGPRTGNVEDEINVKKVLEIVGGGKFKFLQADKI